MKNHDKAHWLADKICAYSSYATANRCNRGIRTGSKKVKCSELLRNKLEDAFGIFLPAPIQRIWGTCGSWKWHVVDDNGVEYGCYYSMQRCVDAKQLVKLENPSNNFVVIDILEL